MKNIALAFCLLICASVQAQDYSEYNSSIRVGAGYSHDFPGLNGYTAFVEYSRVMSDQLQGALGLKLSNMNGYPRTSQVKEHTRARSIDFTIYYLPLNSYSSQLRIGAGYSFSFYDTRRSYPVITGHGGEQVTTWPVQDRKGRVSGLVLTGEYEYFLPETNFSIGARASMFKAYDRVTFAGLFAAVRL